jgi:hypothetical protein
LQAVLASGEVGPFVGDFEGDLRKCQCQQGEIQAAPPQDYQRDYRGQQQGECDGENQRLYLVAEKAAHGYRRGIARAAEEHRGAEWHQSCVADEQVHACAVQRVDGDLGDQAHRRADRIPGYGQCDQD